MNIRFQHRIPSREVGGKQPIRRLLLHLGSAFVLPALLGASLAVQSCGNDAPPLGNAIRNRDSLPVMTSKGVSKLISDSGIIRYKIVAEEWRVFDRTQPPRQEFLKGIFFARFDNRFKVNLFITADTAYCYNQNLWELRGRVFVKNKETGTVFHTEELFWDMAKHELYSNKYMHIKEPTRELEGDSFRSDEQLTRYDIRQSSGFLPMPHEGGDNKAQTPVDTTGTAPVPQRTERMPERKSS